MLIYCIRLAQVGILGSANVCYRKCYKVRGILEVANILHTVA